MLTEYLKSRTIELVISSLTQKESIVYLVIMAVLMLFGPALILRAKVRGGAEQHLDFLLGFIFCELGWLAAGTYALVHNLS